MQFSNIIHLFVHHDVSDRVLFSGIKKPTRMLLKKHTQTVAFFLRNIAASVKPVPSHSVSFPHKKNDILLVRRVSGVAIYLLSRAWRGDSPIS